MCDKTVCTDIAHNATNENNVIAKEMNKPYSLYLGKYFKKLF